MHGKTTPPGRGAFVAVLVQGLPLAFGLASHALVNLVDLALVGQLGEAAVAGVHVATTVNFLPMILGNGISVAAMALMAQRIGAGDAATAAALHGRALWLMLVAGLGVGVLGALLAEPCVRLQGVTGEAHAIGVHYLVVAQLGSVVMFVLMQATSAMRALGESLMPVVVLLLANLLNLALDVVLLFGWDSVGIPALGAAGAAYASVLARLVAAGVALWWIRRPGYPLHPAAASPRREPGVGRRLLVLATPQSVQMALRALGVLVLTRCAAELGGPDAVVALGVTTRLDTLVLFSALGFASAATAQVGLAVGAGDAQRAGRAGWYAAGLAWLLGVAWVVGFTVWSRPLLGLFVADVSEGVLEAGSVYLCTAALAHPFAAFAITATGAMHGRGRFVAPMLVDLCGYSLLLLAVLWTATRGATGLRVVWWVFAAGNAAVALGHGALLGLTAWQHGRRTTLSD